MNAMLDAEHNTTTALVLRTLKVGKERMTTKEVASAAGIRESAVEMMLADAVEDRLLSRSRHPDGHIAYTLVVTPFTRVAEPSQKEPEKATTAKRGPGRAAGERPARLPPIDLSAVRLTMRPLYDGRQRAPQETKWGPVFDKLSKITPNGGEYPTVELDAVYGKAVQAAARKYSKDTGLKLKVSIGSVVCTVQRIE